MKKIITFLLIAITFSKGTLAQTTYSAPATTPAYTQGAVRGLYYGGSGTIVINTTQSNLGNNSSNYLVRVQGCFGGGIQTPIAVNDLNLAASNVACFLGFAQSTQRKDTSWVYGNSISLSTGNNCVFVTPDQTESIYTISNQFIYTGANKTTAQISGATFLPNGKVRVWNNSHTVLPIEINGVPIPWVADLNPANGTVTPRVDLMPSLAAPLTGTAKITTVSVTSTGEVIHLGYFNRRNGGIDIAQKGFIENIGTSVITDLAADNDAFVYTETYCEVNGVGLIGSTNPNPPIGLSSGAFKFNPITYALSAAGGGFGINPKDALTSIVIGENKVTYVGSPRTTPAGGTVGQYDLNTNTWTNLSPGLYLTPGASSSVNYISYTGECACNLIAGNFSSLFPSGTPRASTFTDLAKACPAIVLPLPSELKVISQNPPTVGWQNTPDGAFLEKSTDGRNFITIHTVSNDIKFIDPQFSETSYYRLKIGSKYSNTVVINWHKFKNAMVINQGSYFTIIFPVKTTAILYNMAGQKLKEFSGFSIVVEKQNQLLILKSDYGEVIKLL